MTPRDRLKELFLQRAVQFGDFTLASGKKSTYYVNSKKVLFHAEAITLLGELLYEATKDRRDVVVLTFNVDENPGILARYMQEHALSFPVVLAQEFVNGTMKVESIPLNWIVDFAGVLRFERSAGFDESFVKDTLAAMATTNPSVPSVR